MDRGEAGEGVAERERNTRLRSFPPFWHLGGQKEGTLKEVLGDPLKMGSWGGGGGGGKMLLLSSKQCEEKINLVLS